jgi:hypothetical protein
VYKNYLKAKEKLDETKSSLVKVKNEKSLAEEQLNQLNKKIAFEKRNGRECDIVDLDVARDLKESLTKLENLISAKIPNDIKHLKRHAEILKAQLFGNERSFVNKPKKTTFAFACPHETCRGVLNVSENTYVCVVCGRKTCHECFEISSIDHQCNEETKMSVALMMNDSKPCPKCNTMIFRTYGCNQMWCTQCRTAFDWESGEIFTKNFHNPHHTEWLAQNPQIQDNHMGAVDHDLCVLQFENMDMLRILPLLNEKVKTFNERKVILNIIEQMKHVKSVSIKECTPLWLRREDTHDRGDPTMILRLEYLNGTISKQEFKKKLYQMELTDMMAIDYRHIWETLLIVGNDLLRRFFTVPSSQTQQIKTMLEEVKVSWDDIKRYLRKEHDILNKRYNKSYNFIDSR